MRTVVVILSFMLCLFFCPTQQTEAAVRDYDKATVTSTVSDTAAAQLACCAECNSDLRLPAPEQFSVESCGCFNIVNVSVRKVDGRAAKILSPAVPERHQGRITRIFEFDLFRSSLCEDYYLHSLRRLRI